MVHISPPFDPDIPERMPRVLVKFPIEGGRTNRFGPPSSRIQTDTRRTTLPRGRVPPSPIIASLAPPGSTAVQTSQQTNWWLATDNGWQITWRCLTVSSHSARTLYAHGASAAGTRFVGAKRGEAHECSALPTGSHSVGMTLGIQVLSFGAWDLCCGEVGTMLVWRG